MSLSLRFFFSSPLMSVEILNIIKKTQRVTFVLKTKLGIFFQPKVEDKPILYFALHVTLNYYYYWYLYIMTKPFLKRKQKIQPSTKKLRNNQSSSQSYNLRNSKSCRGRWCSRQGKRGLPTLQWSASKSTALASRSLATKTRSSLGALACTSLSLSPFPIFFFFQLFSVCNLNLIKFSVLQSHTFYYYYYCCNFGTERKTWMKCCNHTPFILMSPKEFFPSPKNCFKLLELMTRLKFAWRSVLSFLFLCCT